MSNTTDTTSTDGDSEAYLCSDRGMFLPLVNESTWPLEGRAFIYLLGLLWSFFGIAIIADIFMVSIEVITSKTVKVSVPDPSEPNGVREEEVRVWNATVANLTLMALGSSCPEIFISIIEVVGNGFQSGDLGPSTIVGSAAFNLLCIIGVCIYTIPTGDCRTVKELTVFGITASCSILAYIWLLVCLVAISPNVVDLWEAICTFLCFPILVIIAYMADKGFFSFSKKQEEIQLPTVGITEVSGLDGHQLTVDKISKEEVSEFMKDLGKHPELTPEKTAALATLEAEKNSSHSRAWYRVKATRGLTGGSRITPAVDHEFEELYKLIKSDDKLLHSSTLSVAPASTTVEFETSSVAVLESEQRVRIAIKRTGKTDNQVLFRYETIDGTAIAVEDYIAKKETLVFEPGETRKEVVIEIVDDNQWEEDEVFFVKLSLEPDSKGIVKLGTKNVMQVTILNDDDPGELGFTNPSYLIKESVGMAEFPVMRTNGTDGKISVTWKTIDMTAKFGSEFLNKEGVLHFDHGEIEKPVTIDIIDKQEGDKDERFKIELQDTTGGAKLGKLKTTIISIVSDDEYGTVVKKVMDRLAINLDHLKLGNASWGEQFKDAMNVNGGDLENASAGDYIMHFLTFGFKVIFALVPPPNFLNSGGWITFCVAISFIGILTIVVSDLAGIFGCLVGLEDSVTAITFVALGTSLPDLFASKTAAILEKNADSSIGNVTGSNSVNVFLGLGLPWLIAAIYWGAKGQRFEVPAGSLSFSVAIYTCFAVICIVLLILRRRFDFFGKAELGGTVNPKIISSCILFTLWILYVLLSTLEVYGYIKSF